MQIARKVNFFEIVLLVVGLSVGIVGFAIIRNLYLAEPVLSWQLFTTVFLWLILIVLLILAATMEDVKEELALVIGELVEETRLLKKLNNSQLEEIKLLREDMRNRKR